MTAPQNALSLSIPGSPDLGGEIIKALYRLTGRSSVELRRALQAGTPIFTAPLFGNEHIDVVPRLEKTVDYLHGLGIGFAIHEWTDGERAEISVEVMREIIEAADGDFV